MAKRQFQIKQTIWGKQILIYPIADFPTVILMAEIRTPTAKGKPPTMTYTFNGLPIGQTVKLSHMTIYADSIRYLTAKVREVTAKMKADKSRGKPRLAKRRSG